MSNESPPKVKVKPEELSDKELAAAISDQRTAVTNGRAFGSALPEGAVNNNATMVAQAQAELDALEREARRREA